MKLGEWVFTVHEENKITGFVTKINDDQVDIFVTIPKGYGSITKPVSKVWDHNETVIWMDDIPALIDLSLQIKDEEWFRKWAHELSLWRPASKLENLISRQ